MSAQWEKGRDDYGRSVQTLVIDNKAVGRVYTVPARVRAVVGASHGSNVWALQGPSAHADHQSLKDAKSRVEMFYGVVAVQTY